MANPTFQFTFSEMDSNESFGRLASSIGTTLVDATITIPPATGKGSICKVKLEEGLTMRVWDFKLTQPFTFKKIMGPSDADRIFHIAWLLNPQALTIKPKGIDTVFRVQDGLNILFVSNDIDIEVEIATEAGLQAIDISFTASWLKRTFAEAGENIQSFIQQVVNSSTPTVFFESTTAEEYRTVSNLYTTALPIPKDLLWIKGTALSLLSGFYSKILSKSLTEVLDSKVFYYDKMIAVEKILKSHLQSKFPGIDLLAKEAMLSESTLMRHFKLMFGKSINEHYLQLKMDHAKRMLLEKPLSVNEVATLLEYEKTSNFIMMFKKIHGISPGSLRRKFI